MLKVIWHPLIAGIIIVATIKWCHLEFFSLIVARLVWDVAV